MPKIKTSVNARLRAFVSEFGDDIFSSDGTVLYCKVCEVKVASEKKFTIEQHISRIKHKNGIERKHLKQSQSFLTTSSKKSTFNYDLCQALLSANIPLHKISNELFRAFLEKYTHKSIPDESTLRKTYVVQCYEDCINKIRSYCENQKLWVSIDETTDSVGRYVANVIVGTLEVGGPGKVFLLNSEILEKANHTSIAKLLDTSLHILWPQGIKYDNILLFLSDAAPYMMKAGRGLKILYSKMEHVSCLAHGLHRVAEEIRKHYPKVDQLISNIKKIFLKCPSRVQYFKEMAPNIPLPPQPVLTRWGTWLKAATYFCEHFEILKTIIMGLNKDDSTSVEKAQDLINDDNVKHNLIYINANFGTLADSITKLETSGLRLYDSIQIVQDILIKIESAAVNRIGNEIKNKFKAVLAKNTGFQTMSTISKILNDEEASNLNMFDIENAYRKPSNRNLDEPFIIVEFASTKKRDEFIKKRSYHRIYINKSPTAFNKKLFWESRMKGKELGYRFIWTSHGRIFCKKGEQDKKIQVKCFEDLNFL
ncbi:hypothetical protein QTP88_027101 [Uroleucon formosanum]